MSDGDDKHLLTVRERYYCLIESALESILPHCLSPVGRHDWVKQNRVTRVQMQMDDKLTIEWSGKKRVTVYPLNEEYIPDSDVLIVVSPFT